MGLAELTQMGVSEALAQVPVDHLTHLTALRANGELISGGPCESVKSAINIFDAKFEQIARDLHGAAPLAKNGFSA